MEREEISDAGYISSRINALLCSLIGIVGIGYAGYSMFVDFRVRSFLFLLVLGLMLWQCMVELKKRRIFMTENEIEIATLFRKEAIPKSLLESANEVKGQTRTCANACLSLKEECGFGRKIYFRCRSPVKKHLVRLELGTGPGFKM